MRAASHVTIKTRDYFGRTIELATWRMQTVTADFAAGYYHGADLLFVRYAATEEEAISLVDLEVDRLTNPTSKIF